MIGLITCQDASVLNTSRLGSGPGAIYFGTSNNNNTPPSTVVAARSSVPQVPTLHLYCFFNSVQNLLFLI